MTDAVRLPTRRPRHRPEEGSCVARLPDPIGRAPSAASFADVYARLGSCLVVQVRSFDQLIVITPDGVVGRHAWRWLVSVADVAGQPRTIAVDLIRTRHVKIIALVSMLTASRRRRLRGTRFLLVNLPPMPGLRSCLSRAIARLARPYSDTAPAPTRGPHASRDRHRHA